MIYKPHGGFKFGKRSLEKLKQADLDLQNLFHEVIKHWDCAVIEGHRGQGRQNQLYENGTSRVRWPGSRHNYDLSLAVDVVPWFKETPHIRWKDTETFHEFGWFVLGIAARMSIPITWGGTWRDKPLDDKPGWDCPHFQYEGGIAVAHYKEWRNEQVRLLDRGKPL